MENESVLVVKREDLFGTQYFNGFLPVEASQTDYLNLILKKGDFKERFAPTENTSSLETDREYQQIIPYLIFTHNHKFFLYKRLPKGEEKRHHHKYSIGIGGHINWGDKLSSKSLIRNIIKKGIEREFHEEMNYKGNYSLKLIGFINDDKDPTGLGLVHFGLVYLIVGSTPDIKIKEGDRLEGQLVTIEEIGSIKDSLESWSAIIFEQIKSSKNLFK